MQVSLVRGLNSAAHAGLLDSMFRARKRLFNDLLCRDVHLNERGWEIDGYDGDEALYIILSTAQGAHIASLRLLSGTGKTELGDVFSAVLDGTRIDGPSVWECSRLVVDSPDPDASHRAMTRLLLALWETAHHAKIRCITGAFEAPTIAALAHAGWVPELIAQSGEQQAAVYLGYWEVEQAKADAIRKAGDLRGPSLDADARRIAAAL